MHSLACAHSPWQGGEDPCFAQCIVALERVRLTVSKYFAHGRPG